MFCKNTSRSKSKRRTNSWARSRKITESTRREDWNNCNKNVLNKAEKELSKVEKARERKAQHAGQENQAISGQ